MDTVKTDNESFLKDVSSGALINNDVRAFNAARARKRTQSRIDELENQVNSLSVSIKTVQNSTEEIKQLLIDLTRK